MIRLRAHWSDTSPVLSVNRKRTDEANARGLTQLVESSSLFHNGYASVCGNRQILESAYCLFSVLFFHCSVEPLGHSIFRVPIREKQGIRRLASNTIWLSDTMKSRRIRWSLPEERAAISTQATSHPLCRLSVKALIDRGRGWCVDFDCKTFGGL